MPSPLVILFGAMTSLGAVYAIAVRGSLRHTRALAATPPLPITGAPGGSRVHVRGRIQPSEQGVILTPFTKRRAVWARIAVQELRGRDWWDTILQAEEGRTFLVEDGSGEKARVTPARACVLAEREIVAESGFLRDLPAEIEEFLRERGLTSKGLFNFNKSLRCVEEVLLDGGDISAFGPSIRKPGPTVTNGYRSIPSSELALAGSASREAELILATDEGARKPLEQLKLFGAMAFAVIGAVALVMTLILG
jgi:hypothetical protein